MPFTAAHPLAAVPLRRLGLPLTALAIGAMAPDMVLFAPIGVTYPQSHSLRGVVGADVLVGGAALITWCVLMRTPLADAAPRWMRERMVGLPQAPARPRVRQVVLSIIALMLGALTHIIWDSFTHSRGWAVRHLPVLQGTIGPVPVSEIAQYASGAVGVAGLTILAVRALARRTPQPAPRRVASAPLLLAAPVLTALATVLIIAVTQGSELGLHRLAFVMVVRGIGAAVIVCLLGCALWWLRVLTGSAGGRHGMPERTGSTGRVS